MSRADNPLRMTPDEWARHLATGTDEDLERRRKWINAELSIVLSWTSGDPDRRRLLEERSAIHKEQARRLAVKRAEREKVAGADAAMNQRRPAGTE